MNAVEIQGLTKRYGAITAVDSLDLAVRQGELFALLGVNGAGKTTTIKMLSCLTRPDGGDARLLGRSIVSDAARGKALHRRIPPGDRRGPQPHRPGESGAAVRRPRSVPAGDRRPHRGAVPGPWGWSPFWPAGPGSSPAAGSGG